MSRGWRWSLMIRKEAQFVRHTFRVFGVTRFEPRSGVQQKCRMVSPQSQAVVVRFTGLLDFGLSSAANICNVRKWEHDICSGNGPGRSSWSITIGRTRSSVIRIPVYKWCDLICFHYVYTSGPFRWRLRDCLYGMGSSSLKWDSFRYVLVTTYHDASFGTELCQMNFFKSLPDVYVLV